METNMKAIPDLRKRNMLYALTLALILASGCVDYGIEAFYTVENKLHQKIIVIFETYSEHLKSDTINPHTSKEIFKTFGLCGKNTRPQKYDPPFTKIEIFYKDTIKILSDFKNPDNWSFSSKVYEGRYLLVIDTTFLK
jgi:hypothetical protein